MGPGDPQLDVGTFLAHLRNMAHFDIAPEACLAYRRQFRCAALKRFGWEEPELDLREALALFRLSANHLSRPQNDWLRATETGLSMVAEVLAGAV